MEGGGIRAKTAGSAPAGGLQPFEHDGLDPFIEQEGQNAYRQTLEKVHVRVHAHPEGSTLCCPKGLLS